MADPAPDKPDFGPGAGSRFRECHERGGGIHRPATNAAPQSAFLEFIGKHIYGYEPIYFILGQYPAAEFQFSLKYKLFDLAGNWDPLAYTYFAYTQTSLWDLITRDPSFYDTSYKPSAFLFYPDIIQKNRLQFDLQGGYEHESNGKGGTGERSLNTLYLQPTVRFDLPAHFQFLPTPRLGLPFPGRQ